MKRKRLLLVAFLLSCFFILKAQKEIYPSDAGSNIHFVIKNFGIKTGGDFSGLKGTIKFDSKNPSNASFDVSVNSSTINTDNDSRDGHLKKEEYFDVKKYPAIHLVSTKIQGTTKAGRYQFTGNLTIKKTTKPVTFQFTAVEKDGGYLFVSDDITINRRDFEVGSNSISLADELKLTISVLAK
ncbi:MAG: YceI family protein [Ferruginibacter sp.]